MTAVRTVRGWWLRYWRALGFLAAMGFAALALYGQYVDNRQSHEIAAVLQQVDAARVESDINACERGNNLRQALRHLVAEVIARSPNPDSRQAQANLRLFTTGLADIDCTTTPITQERSP